MLSLADFECGRISRHHPLIDSEKTVAPQALIEPDATKLFEFSLTFIRENAISNFTASVLVDSLLSTV